MKVDLYIPRSYRTKCQDNDLTSFVVQVDESDLFIRADSDLAYTALDILVQLRREIENYINQDASFLDSLSPLTVPIWAPVVVKKMVDASLLFDIGPMASVAGGISEEVARRLQKHSQEVIVENGGDLFIISQRTINISIAIDYSHFSKGLIFELQPCPEGVGVCTSSGKIGHSLSYGNADAVTVIARSGYYADAAATAICNMAKSEDDIQEAIRYARQSKEIIGLIIVMQRQIGIFGETISLIRN